MDEMSLRFSFSDGANDMAKALCKYCVHPFKCFHLRYSNI